MRLGSWAKRVVSGGDAVLEGVLDLTHPRFIDLAMRQHKANPWQADPPQMYCSRCGASSGPYALNDDGCAFCKPAAVEWNQLVRLGAYQQPVSDWVLALKYQQKWRWGPWLGARLAEVLPKSDNDAMTALCPVPMHWRRRWFRNYNHAWLIAQGIAEKRHWPVLDLLARTVHRPSQTAVQPHERVANVRRCMKAHNLNLTGWHIWLVDDVKTSGSTLRECTQLLKAQGAAVVNVAVVCVADPKGQNFTRI